MLIVTIRKNKIRNKLKEIGRTIFMTAYRNHQLRLDEEEMTSAEQTQQGNETLGEDETISTNSGSAFSAYDNLEEELNRLTRAQLRTRLHEEAPDICNNGRRGDILRRLIRCIREKEEWPQPEDQVIQAQNVNIELDRIFGNDVVVDRNELQEENIEAAREFLQMYGGTGGSDEVDQIDIAEPNTEQAAGMTVVGGQQTHDIGSRTSQYENLSQRI
jgi:hypothetical protein